jgi:predicted  nucleic acid-binding Zn-ribbon protein
MSSSPSDLRRLTPWMREVDAALDANEDAIAEHEKSLAKQDAKLGEHDRHFARWDEELTTLRNQLSAQIGHIDETLRRMRLGIGKGNGNGR